MQNRVLDSAAVEIDRQPVLHHLRVERLSIVAWIGEAIEVPRRVDERIHRVGLSTRGAATLRTLHVDELGYLRQGRVAASGELSNLWELHWQLAVRHRHDAVFLAVDHRDRRAPVPLA